MRDWCPQVKRLVALTSLLAALPCWSAFAQVAASTSAEVASYMGADRTEKLIAGAKKAGTVTVYTSANTEDMTVLADAFEKKYGVKVRVWRASSEQVVQRGVTEAREAAPGGEVAGAGRPQSGRTDRSRRVDRDAVQRVRRRV